MLSFGLQPASSNVEYLGVSFHTPIPLGSSTLPIEVPPSMRKLSGYGPSLIVLGTAAVTLLAGPMVVQKLTYEQTRTQVIQARLNLESNDVLARINQATRDIATVVEPSVVHVSAHYLDETGPGPSRVGLSTGSGWVYDELGHVVTNHHVIANAQRIDVQLHNGEIREAEVVGSDESTDIAVIKISSGRLHPATLASLEEPVNQGDMVFAFGSPFDFRFSMSSGVVSGKGRSVGVIRDESGRRQGYENFIQVDAAINPGNSGGPLTDYRGHVIGMNTAIATGRRNSAGLEEGQFAGIGLAIPTDMIVPVVTQVIKYGYVEKGFMGVNVGDLNVAVAQQLGFIGAGVLITAVDAQGPAGAAGVKTNDIVTQVNNRPVSTVAQLQSIISSMLPGESAKLTIWRFDPKNEGGEAQDLLVALNRLDTLRAAGQLPPDNPKDSIVPLGIARMTANTAEVASRFGVDFHPGVLLEELVRGSELARRIKPGSVITDIADRPVRNVDELLRVLKDFDLRFPGVKATVIDRDGQFAAIYLRAER